MEDEISSLKLYKRIESIDSGSYGDVCLYECNSIRYAIKRVTMYNTISTMIEISMYNSLSHPNIIKPLETISLKKGIENVVMQLAQLPLYLAIDNVITYDQIIIIMHQLLNALDYLHQNNVIHRDIKPDNILLIGSSPQIIDFGLSTYMFLETCKYHNVYTYHYRAPEVYAELPYDTKADIFAMGATLFEMIYRYQMAPNIDHRIGLKGYIGMLLSIRNAKELISDDLALDRDLKQLLLSMIDEDPKRRLSAKDLLHLPIFRDFTYADPDIVLWEYIDPDEFPEARKPKAPFLSAEALKYAARLSVKLLNTDILQQSSALQIKNIGLIIAYVARCVYDDSGYDAIYNLMELPNGDINYNMVELALKIFKLLNNNIIIV